MPKHSKQISVGNDFAFTRNIIHKGKLDECLLKLDAKNIEASLAGVPFEIIRLVVTLASKELSESDIKNLGREKQVPAKRLLVALRQQQNVREFVGALVEKASSDPSIEDRLGIRFAKGTVDKQEILTNDVTSISGTPQLVLKSRRLYCEIGFWRGDELLFRSDFEIESLIWAGKSMLNQASMALKHLMENAGSIKPEIDIEACKRELKNLAACCSRVKASLSRIGTKRRHSE
jgi:hypothetical protein